MKHFIALFLLVWLGASGQISPSSAALRGTDFTLFDSFQRANVVGSLGIGPYGVPWDIRGKSDGTYPIPAGTNAYLQGTLFKTTPPVGASNGATYIVHQFSNTVSRIGARVNWSPGNTPGGSEATLAILISTNSNLISDMVHWIVYRTAWDLQIRVADGVFQTIYHGTMSVPTNGLSHIYEMSVNNDTVTLNVDGEIFSFNDSRVSSLIGPYAVWEHYYNDNTYNSRLNIEAVWAGATPAGAWSGNVFSGANGNSSIGYTNAVPADPTFTWDINGVLGLSSGAFATRQGVNNVIFTGSGGLAILNSSGLTTRWTFDEDTTTLQSFGAGAISSTSGDLDLQSGGNDTDIGGLLKLGGSAFANKTGGNNILYTGTAGLAIQENDGVTTRWTFSEGSNQLQSNGAGEISSSSGILTLQSGGGTVNLGGLVQVGGSAFANKSGGNNILYTETAGLAIVDNGGATTLWTFSEGVPGLQSNGAGAISTSAGDLSIQSGGNRTVVGGLLNLNGGATPAPAAFGDTSSDNNAWAASRGALTFYDGTAATFLVGTLASDVPSNGQVPTWNTGGTITWETASGGVALSGITAATGDNAIQNGAFNQLWRFTDPGTGEINLELTGTNSTASGLLYVRGQMTHATAVQTSFTETTASTGGSGAQDLVRIGTLAASTATPVAFYQRGARVLEVGYNAPQLWAATESVANTPFYSFAGLKSGGMKWDGSSIYMQNNDSDYISVSSSTIRLICDGRLDVTSTGIEAYNGDRSVIVLNTGDSSRTGIEYRNRVLTTTTGTVTLSDVIAGNNALGPGSVQNNSGASAGVTYNLPAAAAGLTFTFTVMDADGITIDAAGTDTIQINTAVTSAGGTLASATVGNTCQLVCVAAGKWIATFYVGTIAVTWTTT